jgi:hypothetical protein
MYKIFIVYYQKISHLEEKLEEKDEELLKYKDEMHFRKYSDSSVGEGILNHLKNFYFVY